MGRLLASHPPGVKGEPTISRAISHAGETLNRERLHPEVAIALRRMLGSVCYTMGRPSEAEHHMREEVALRRAQPDGDAHGLLMGLTLLSGVLRENGKADEAVAAAREAVGLTHDQGVWPQDRAWALQELGSALMAKGDLKEAETTLRASLDVMRAGKEFQERDLVYPLGNLGAVLLAADKLDEAERVLSEAITLRPALLAGDLPALGNCILNLGLVLERRDLPEIARQRFEEARDVHEAALGADHPWTARDKAYLGSVLVTLGRAEEAEALLREALIVLERHHPLDRDAVRSAQDALERLKPPQSSEPNR
jgi:tetratricopeptide (TPR) repeat protein